MSGQPNGAREGVAGGGSKVLSQDVKGTNGLEFKSGHSEPEVAPVPLGRTYGEFNRTVANDSRPKDKVVDKVDSDSVMHSAESGGNMKNG